MIAQPHHPDVPLRGGIDLAVAAPKDSDPDKYRFATVLVFLIQRSLSANERTGNLKLTQKLLGRSNISTTADVYTHISEEAEREAALAVEGAIRGDLVLNLFPTRKKTSNLAVN